MFDWIKFKIEEEEIIHRLYDNEKLILRKSVSTMGKHHTIITDSKKYLNMIFDFKIIDGYIIDVTIKGSIHYYSNNGIHNANILTFKGFKNAIEQFSSLFEINLKETILLPCEYGFNITYRNQDSIVYNCMTENRKTFRQNVSGKPSVISGGSTSDYQMKVYNKSEQFKHLSCDDILRIENKNNRSRSWSKKGIKTLNDLMNLDNNYRIFNQFLDRFKGIILYDEHIPIDPKNNGKTTLYSNINYWRKLAKKGSHNKEYNYQKRLLENLSKKEGCNIKGQLQILIENQFIHNYGLCHYLQGVQKNILTNAQLVKFTNAHIDKMCTSE